MDRALWKRCSRRRRIYRPRPPSPPTFRIPFPTPAITYLHPPGALDFRTRYSGIGNCLCQPYAKSRRIVAIRNGPPAPVLLKGRPSAVSMRSNPASTLRPRSFPAKIRPNSKPSLPAITRIGRPLPISNASSSIRSSAPTGSSSASRASKRSSGSVAWKTPADPPSPNRVRRPPSATSTAAPMIASPACSAASIPPSDPTIVPLHNCSISAAKRIATMGRPPNPCPNPSLPSRRLLIPCPVPCHRPKDTPRPRPNRPPPPNWLRSCRPAFLHRRSRLS